MGRVVVAGAGGFGREVAAWLTSDPHYLAGDSIRFLDDNPSVLDRFPHLQPLLIGTLSSFEPKPGDRLVLGIALPQVKAAVDAAFTQRGISFSTFIHDSAIVAEDAAIGVGSVICPHVVVAPGAVTGRCGTLNVHATIGHDAVVGDYTSLMSHVDVTGWTRIGDRCFLGSHASVVLQRTVGEGASIGAGSVVMRDVPPGATVIGVPARRIDE